MFTQQEQQRIKADIMKYYSKVGKSTTTKNPQKELKHNKTRQSEGMEGLAEAEWRVKQKTYEAYKEAKDIASAKEYYSKVRKAQDALEKQYEQRYSVEIGSGGYHSNIRDILVNIEVGNLVFLVGPAGSGKTTIAMSVADILQKNFYFTGAVHQKHELLGFNDAQGRTIRTPFREAYEHGGVFLFDEYDASAPHAITAFNAALSNGKCAFPDGIVEAHEDFVAIAAGNTYGTGATRQYVGRFQQDAASLDRFVFIEIDYDVELETRIALKAYNDAGGQWNPILYDYLKELRKIRRVVRELGMAHIVSPRAAIQGAKLLAKGMPRSTVENIAIYKGMGDEQRKQIQNLLTPKGNKDNDFDPH